MKQYAIVIKSDLVELAAEMDRSFAAGWQPIGGLSMTFDPKQDLFIYAQAIGRQVITS